MRTLITVAVCLLCFSVSFSQKTKVPPNKYPSLLWEISGKGMSKPSYLFGTMHVSSKMVFHLSDSFYLGIKNADVVALETDMGSWQEDFSRYDMEGQGMYSYFSRWRDGNGSPSDYININTLQVPSYEKMIEMALYSSPSIINNFLYRSYSEKSSDFEEDTYLDLHIYQAGKKWGKKVCGVENFDQSMQLMKEAYVDASKEKEKKQRNYDYDEGFSYANMEDAYRTGNLDLLDTINKVNSTSAAFDEKFLYKRNEIQANSIDSILKSKSALFVGVGAAHLPGQRGVIELLRKMGYKLRPIKMNERDSRHKDEVEKIRVPVQFHKENSADGFFSVSLPGKLYDFSRSSGIAEQQQFADMSNGSYYMVTRINANTVLWGHSEDVVLRKIDSVIYENVPGKILSKQSITRNGYKGFEVVNKTRRGDFQRYNIFVTPFEVILFKMSGNGEYVKDGKEADQFFNSIELRDFKTDWKKWSPSFGGFEVELPHQPVISKQDNWQFMAMDKSTGTGFGVIRTDIHNYEFVEEDSFDLNLMEESFAASEFIDKQISRKQGKLGGYATLDARYKYKDGSVALVKFLIQGTHYYTLLTHARTENPRMKQFLNSFSVKPFIYPEAKQQADTSLYFTVKSAVPLEKSKKISMVPENMYRYGGNQDEDAILEDRGIYKDRLVASDSTGEKIYVSFNKPSRYYYYDDSAAANADTIHFKTDRMNWVFLNRKKSELPNGMKVFEYRVGDPKSTRYVQGKVFSRDAVNFRIETEGDALSKPSEFISDFFESFSPSDTVKGTNAKEKKSGLFFADFFSADTMLHKRAVRNVRSIGFDSTDFVQIKKAIGSLNWKEKKYMNVKTDFIIELASIHNKEASDYLKQLYFNAGDTVELQYIALNALLQQKTSYSYSVFKDIMITEPPVLDVKISNSGYRVNNRYMPPVYGGDYDVTTTDYSDGDGGSFMSNLTDSLQLTTSVFKDLLPLINIDDYEKPMMNLMGTLVDSNMIHAKDYETYLPKLLIEAKQQLKKQVINEKNKSIEKAQEDDEDAMDSRRNSDEDYGNSKLSLYATLLMPFWDQSPAVPALIKQLLTSADKKLKYNTTILLLEHKKPVPDTMLNYFAKLDEYRYELYADLTDHKMISLFPAAFNNKVELAKSKLIGMSSYDKPDSIIFLEKFAVQQKERSGYVYFFKYKQKKEDNSWKLASVGIIPSDPKVFEFEPKGNYYEESQYNFTNLRGGKIENDEPLNEQLKKAFKKLQYSKRNSSAEFYTDDDRMGMNYLKQMNFRD